MIEIPSLRPETRYGMPAADQVLFNREYIVGYSYASLAAHAGVPDSLCCPDDCADRRGPSGTYWVVQSNAGQ